MNNELLSYSERLGWHYFSQARSLQMTDATFQQFVNAYLQYSGVTQPTYDQLILARQHCRNLAFWDECNDSAISRYTSGR